MAHRSHNHPPHRPECVEHPVGACLVVIDPEDREQVERLISAWFNQACEPKYPRMANALRSLVAPPRPAEPIGLGAVVEAIYDNRFVRIDKGSKAWLRVGDIEVSATYSWSEIDVVRVLSEGES